MIYILFPACNEEKSIDYIFPRIRETMQKEELGHYHIIICNDGSTDRTLEKIEYYQKTMPMTIINHKINRGLGETSRDLFERAAEMANDNDIIIRLDCDDTHDPKYICGLIDELDNGYDVVIASRFARGGGQEGLNAYRAVCSWCANKVMKMFFPIKRVAEYSCVFRAYRASVIKKAIKTFGNNFIQLKGLGFTCTLEKLLKLNMLGAKFSEYPFVLKYHQKRSPSKMIGSVTMFGYVVMVVLYYWPWGGWRRGYKHIEKLYEVA